MSMLASHYLNALRALPLVSLEALTGEGNIVVVAPHPDDESLGCGGLIAEAIAAGRRVRLIIISDGTGSHPNSVSWPADRLRALREAETIEAAGALGVPKTWVTFLRLPDRFVPTAGPVFEAAVVDVRRAALQIGGSAIVTTWQHDPHCDHQASFAIAKAAQRELPETSLLIFPVWGWRLDGDKVLDEPPPRGGRLAVSEHIERKRRAIAAHRSQTTDLIDDDPSGFRLEQEMIELFDRPFETFVEISR
jgi:LmbE family N-acetylglucosaminyl deacetylase